MASPTHASDATPSVDGRLYPEGGQREHAVLREALAKHRLFVVLAAVFVTFLVLGDVTGGKAFLLPYFGRLSGPVSVGMIFFPMTFLLTDVVNDFYGRKGAQFLTAVGAGMATLSYFALTISTSLVTHRDSYFSDAEYTKIFGGSTRLFAASLVAYLAGQLLDIAVFQFWKRLTRNRYLWLRATGSTLISQLLDTITVNALFWGTLANKEVAWISDKIQREYVLKIVIAVALTPLIYALHGAISHWLQLKPEAILKPK